MRERDLTTPDDEQFQRVIGDGTINPDLERKEVAKIRGTQGTGDNEWFTPATYIKLARDVLGDIDLDPAQVAVMTAQEVLA